MRHSILVLLVILCGTVPRAEAHPVPEAVAVVDCASDGTCVVLLHADVAALVMQATPGHLGEERAAELRAMADKELQAWVDDANKALTYRLIVAFDGQRASIEEMTFPDLAELRRNAVAHNPLVITSRIRIQVRMPNDAKLVNLTFPPDLGPVRLTLRRDNTTLHTQRLEAGQASGDFALDTTAVDRSTQDKPPQHPPMTAFVIGAVVLLLLLAGLKRRRIRSPS